MRARPGMPEMTWEMPSYGFRLQRMVAMPQVC